MECAGELPHRLSQKVVEAPRKVLPLHPTHIVAMTLPTPSQIANLDDQRLEELATGWRAQARRGDRQAFGVAHAFEVERRRRMRLSELQQLEPLTPVAPSKPWWKFW